MFTVSDLHINLLLLCSQFLVLIVERYLYLVMTSQPNCFLHSHLSRSSIIVLFMVIFSVSTPLCLILSGFLSAEHSSFVPNRLLTSTKIP